MQMSVFVCAVAAVAAGAAAAAEHWPDELRRAGTVQVDGGAAQRRLSEPGAVKCSVSEEQNPLLCCWPSWLILRIGVGLLLRQHLLPGLCEELPHVDLQARIGFVGRSFG